MIEALIVKHPNGTYKGFRISGHSGYAEAGQDIICAAVSALAINTVNSVEALTADSMTGSQKDGFLQFKFTGRCSKESELLMRSLVIGLTNIQEEYGKSYLKLSFKEV